MKRLASIASLLGICAFTSNAQAIYDYLSEKAPEAYKYNDYYYQRASHFAELPVDSDDIIILGNSLSDNGRWNEAFDDANIKNRGIISDVVQGVSDRIELITKGQPKKIFLLIGVNDVSHHLTPDSITTAVEKLIVKIKTLSPNTELYLQSWLPINNDFKRYKNMIGKEMTIFQGNVMLEQVARRQGVNWINLFPAFADKEMKLPKHLTNDGLHLNEAGYRIWCQEIAKYINPDKQLNPNDLYPIDGEDIVLVGNQLIGGPEWHELFDNANVKSRNSWTDVVDGLPALAKTVAKKAPKQIVLLPSYNGKNLEKGHNLSGKFEADSIVAYVEQAIKNIKETSPNTEIVLQSLIPVNSTYEKYADFKGTAKKAKATNKKLQKLAKKYKIQWVDVYTTMVDEKGDLKAEYTNDGFKLMGKGYSAWAEALKAVIK
jgi:lysophospholipase L1-like esterase